LGCIYKILTKVLAGRLQTFLPSIIRPNQIGFVEGRSILDNIFMAQDSLSWAEESNQDLVLLLLDFEKAFDKIEWNFLFSAMDHIGFNNTWIKWVRTLYREASSAIKVNGVVGPTFQLARSVRQGCPLTPYLFIIATDILGYMLVDPRHGIEGLTLPKGAESRTKPLSMTQHCTSRATKKTSTGPRVYLKSSARPQEPGSTRINPPQYGRARERESGTGGRKSASNGSPEARASDT
jgi:hypothetical protein